MKDPDAQEAIAGVLLKVGAAHRVVVASGHDEALDAFRQAPFPRVRRPGTSCASGSLRCAGSPDRDA